MYCRNCGTLLNNKAEVCVKCGCRPLNGNNYCQECGAETSYKQEICTRCGCRLRSASGPSYDQNSSNQGVYNQNAYNQNNYNQGAYNGNAYGGYGQNAYGGANLNLNFGMLSPYWQMEFQQIYNSGEMYKGRWNWCAFLFGCFWAFSKGCWLAGLVSILVSACTAGIGGVVFWFIFGSRGNYMYYNSFVKNKQIPV